MNTDWYKNEAKRQVSDAKYYSALRTDPTPKYLSNITRVLKRLHADKAIDDHLLGFLTPVDCKPGHLYLLPKIHKPENPGRPIVSANGTLTETILSFVDYLIKISHRLFHLMQKILFTNTSNTNTNTNILPV